MTQREKKAWRMHKMLIVLIILLGALLLIEISREGIGWFSKEVGVKPQRRGYAVVPSYEWEMEEWDPYKEMERIQRRIDRWFNYMWRTMPEMEFKRIEMFEPEIDLTETENEYIVTCDLPGMTKEEISVSVSGNYLTISGTRSIKKEETKEGGYCYKERRCGYFKRTVLLPGPVSENNVKAGYNEGILTIRIQKPKPLEEAKPKKVQII